MIQKNNPAQKTASLKVEDIFSKENLSNDLWCELSENTQELVRGGASNGIKWKNWEYTYEIGWNCQPGKVC
ncbi:MAG: hypothetical protein KME31_24430 [Tolypothrix carrinoi HA7290-LM1]|jgi:hypothetical protein|nr:hypothetical protein [Tolypothrix carrinoi HA7290-LM1]